MKSMFINKLGYVPTESFGTTSLEDNSPIEVLKYFQDMNIRVLTSKDWYRTLLGTQARVNKLSKTGQTGFKEYLISDSLLKNMQSGKPEVVETLIAFPNDKGDYAPNIKPKIEKINKYPVMIEGFTITGNNKKYTIEKGIRSSLREFLVERTKPKFSDLESLPFEMGHSHFMKESVDELGLPKEYWFDASNKLDNGLGIVVRNIRGIGDDSYLDMHIRRPSEPISDLTSRVFFSDKSETKDLSIRKITEAKYNELCDELDRHRGSITRIKGLLEEEAPEL
jgi:hypothetical protein